jgi:hypothetical protein
MLCSSMLPTFPLQIPNEKRSLPRVSFSYIWECLFNPKIVAAYCTSTSNKISIPKKKKKKKKATSFPIFVDGIVLRLQVYLWWLPYQRMQHQYCQPWYFFHYSKHNKFIVLSNYIVY